MYIEKLFKKFYKSIQLAYSTTIKSIMFTSRFTSCLSSIKLSALCHDNFLLDFYGKAFMMEFSNFKV